MISNTSNPLKVDPTRSATLRRMFVRELTKRFLKLKGKILRLVTQEDAFGLKTPRPFTVNTRWRFNTDPEKVEEFRKWIQEQVDADIIPTSSATERGYWNAFIEDGYRKGAGRAFDDVRKPNLQQSDFFAGTKHEFLRSSFGRPETIEKIQLLAGRVFTDLKGVTEAMSTTMTRELASGLAQGNSPHKIASDLNKAIDSIGKRRATVIARTEIVRAHAEGQLDALEQLGVDQIGVMVEWSAANDDRTCPLCLPLDGIVMTIKEARGTIPRHPQCRCAYIPANVGEPPRGQVRSKKQVDSALDKSIRAEVPASKGDLAERRRLSRWNRPKIRKTRPVPKVSPRLNKISAVPVEIRDNLLPHELKEFRELANKRGPLNKLVKAGTATPEQVAEAEFIKNRLAELRNIARGRARGVAPKPPTPKPTPTPKPKVEKKTKPKPPSDKDIPQRNVRGSSKYDKLSLEEKLKVNDDINEVLDKVKKAEDRAILKRKRAIQKASRKVKKLEEELEELYDVVSLAERTGDEKLMKQTLKKIEVKQKKILSARQDFNTATFNQSGPRDEALEALKIPESERVKIKVKYRDSSPMPEVKVVPVDDEYKRKVQEAVDFIESVLAQRVEDISGPIAELEYHAHRMIRAAGKDTRAFYNMKSQRFFNTDGIYLTSQHDVSVFVHELIHRLEDESVDILRQAQEFRRLRIARAGTKDVSLKKLFPNSNYDASEFGNDDSWGHLYPEGSSAPYYIGKDYGNATEVLTMGVELLYRDPVGFALKDPEFFKFIIGVFRGTL